MQLLDFHAWTFFFGFAFVVGLYSLHRLSFVHEIGGPTPAAAARPALEARRSIRSLSSAAGLLRVVMPPSWRVRSPAAEPPALGRDAAQEVEAAPP